MSLELLFPLIGIAVLIVVVLVGEHGCGGDCNQGRRDCDCEDNKN